MKNLIIPLTPFLISVFLVGCAPRTLNAGAQNVHLYDYLAPKSCKFMGDIVNSNVHGDLYLGSSVADLQKDDVNFLKNEGAKLGANVVVLVSHESYGIEKKRLGKHPSTITINEHSVMGRAYYCSSGLMPESAKRSTTHVKINETPLI